MVGYLIVEMCVWQLRDLPSTNHVNVLISLRYKGNNYNWQSVNVNKLYVIYRPSLQTNKYRIEQIQANDLSFLRNLLIISVLLWNNRIFVIIFLHNVNQYCVTPNIRLSFTWLCQYLKYESRMSQFVMHISCIFI